jgi:hypothetical protein
MPDKHTSGCLKFFLIGCVVCIVLAVGGAVGMYYLVKTKGLDFAASLITTVTNKAVAESGLSEEEQQGIKDQVGRVTERIKSGEIALTDWERFANTMDQAPFVGLLVLAGFEQGIVHSSGLSKEEKEDASVTIQRVQKGLVEKKIDMTDLKGIADNLGSVGAEGSGSGSDNLSEEEIRTLMADLKTQADEAEISDGTFTVDYVAETRKAVDVLLGEDTSGEVDSATP